MISDTQFVIGFLWLLCFCITLNGICQWLDDDRRGLRLAGQSVFHTAFISVILYYDLPAILLVPFIIMYVMAVWAYAGSKPRRRLMSGH